MMKTRHFLAMVSTLALVAGCDMLGGGAKGHLKGDPNDAAAALSALGLAESGKDGVTFASKDVKGAKAVYKNLTFAPSAEDGEGGAPLTVATATFEGLDLDANGNAVFGRLTLEGIGAKQEKREISEEVPVWVDPFDPEVPAEGDAEPAPQFETVTRTEPGFEFSVGKIMLDNPSPEVAAWFTSLSRDGEDGTAPDAPPLDKWSFDAFSIDAVGFKVDDPEAAFDFSLGKISSAKLKDGKLGESLMSGLNMTFAAPDMGAGFPINGSFTLDSFDVKGLNLGLFGAAFEAGYNEGAGLEDAPAPTIKAPVSPIDPGYDSSKLGALAINVSGLSLTSPGGTSTTKRDSEGRAISASSPSFSLLFKADPAAGPLAAPVGGVLGMLGYQQLELTSVSDATWDPATDLTTIKTYSIDVKDAVSVNLSGKLTALKDVMAAIYGNSTDPTAALGALTNVGINALEIKLADKSLLDRSFNALALSQGGDAAALRQMVVDQIAAGSTAVTGFGLDPAFATILSGPITEFVKSGGELTISLNPATPVKLSELENPAAATTERLGLTVTRK